MSVLPFQCSPQLVMLCSAPSPTGDSLNYTFGKEIERMGFDLKNTWRIAYANDDFRYDNIL